MKLYLKSLVVAAGLMAASTAFAQEPVQNISSFRHGNLADAQSLSRQAFDKMTAAQQANEYQLGGHAGRAKELLRQANVEMKLAAQAANQR